MSTTNTPPTVNMPGSTVAKPVKKPSIWKYRLIIGFLGLIILVMLAGAAYGGWYGWTWSESKKTQIAKLSDEVDTLKKEKNLSSDDLQKKINEQEAKINELTAQNTKLSADLSAAQAKVDQLTPKNIKDFKHKEFIKANNGSTLTGGDWLNPIYVDLTGDGKEDGVFAYKMSGTGGYLNVYVYSYLSTNSTLSQLLAQEGYQKGSVAALPESIIEIKSEAGTPDAPVTASSKFKYDSLAKKMVKA